MKFEFEFAMRFLDLVNSGLIRDYATNLRGLSKSAHGGRISCTGYELRAMLTYDRETVTCHWVLSYRDTYYGDVLNMLTIPCNGLSTSDRIFIAAYVRTVLLVVSYHLFNSYIIMTNNDSLQ